VKLLLLALVGVVVIFMASCLAYVVLQEGEW
jgi:hypothetical protein